MSLKGHSGGSTHHKGAEQCSGGGGSGSGDSGGGGGRDNSNTSSQLDPEPSTSTADMGGDQKFSRSSREMRNMAEKMRRDRLNSCINELAGIVPLCSGSSKRLDKTSTLRLAANYICMHKLLMGEENGGEKVPPALGGNIAHSLAEAVGGFLLVVTSTGKVIYVTEAIEQFLGHSQVDLLGQSIYNVIHLDDHEIFQQHLVPKGSGRVSFFCRMMEKALTRNEPGRYEIIHVVGQLKPIPVSVNSIPASPSSSVVSPGARSNSDTDDNCDSEGESDSQSLKASVNRIGTHILTSFVRVVKDRPITELSLVESTLDEYITRHGLTGKILYTDHRISFVTGLMPSDVIGKSAFSYMHPDDRVWSIVAQKLMFSSTQGQGIVSYRLKCCDGSLVTLRSRGYLEVDKQTGQVESFVCINTVVGITEADEEIKNQKRKLLPIISSQDCDEHLKSISNTFPQELLKDVLPMLTPEALQNLCATFQRSEMEEREERAKITELDSPVLPKQNCEASPDVVNNFKERRSEPSPYQSKAKKICSVERFDSSVKECTISPPEGQESVREAQPNSNCYSTSYKQTPVEDFNMVVTKNFSFEREQFKQNPIQIEQQLTPAASPQVQVRSPYNSQYGSNNCYSSPSPQYNTANYTDQTSAKGHSINMYQQSKSPNVLQCTATGGISPLGNTDEFIPGVNNFSVDGNIISIANQKSEDFSPRNCDQVNLSPGFPTPNYSPAIEEDINTRMLYKSRDTQNSVTPEIISPVNNFPSRIEPSVSPGGTYPFISVSDDLLLSENTEDNGHSAYTSSQEGRDNISLTTAALSSPSVSPGCQSIQQVESDGSTSSRNQSGAALQAHSILSQFSPNSMMTSRDQYHYQQHQQHRNHQQQQQQIPLQQQQQQIPRQQQQQQQQIPLQQQQQQIPLQQQQQQIPLQQQQQQIPRQQQQQQQQIPLQQQQQQQIPLQQQHHHFQPSVLTANAKHNFSDRSPKFCVEVQGQLSNQIPENNGPVNNWQSRSSDVPLQSTMASKSPEMYRPPNSTHIENESGQALQCNASLHLNTAKSYPKSRNIPDQPDAYYRRCSASPQRIVQSHLTTQYKNFSPQLKYSPSQGEVEGESL